MPRSRIPPFVALGALLALLTACGDSDSDVAFARSAAGTVNGLCPVREQLVVPHAFAEYAGQKIGFCCPPCKPEFLGEPETYMGKMRRDRERFGYIGS